MKLKIIPIAIILMILISPFAWATGGKVDTKVADNKIDTKVDEGKTIDKTKESKKDIKDVPKELDGKIKVKDTDTSKYSAKKLKGNQIRITKDEVAGEHTKTTLSIDRETAKGIDLDNDGIFGYARIVDGQVVNYGTITLDELVAGIPVTFSTTIIDGFSGSYTKTGSSQTVSQTMSLGQSFNSANTSSISVSLSATPYSSTDPYTEISSLSPRLWLRNDGASGTSVAVDSSTYHNNGTKSTTITSVNGRYNNASLFNENADYITIPHTSNYNFTSGFTLMATVNGSYTTGAFHQIFRKQSAPTPKAGYEIYINSRYPCFALYNASGVQYISGSQALSNNTRYQLVGTYNGTHAKLYVNNVLRGTKYIKDAQFGTDNIIIGRYASGYYNFIGKIDDIILIPGAINETTRNMLYYDDLRAVRSRSNANSTYSTYWNGSGSNPLTVPVKSSDGTITSLSYSVPTTITYNGVTIYGFNSSITSLTFVPVATILFTEDTTLVSETAGPVYFNVSINHTKQNNYQYGNMTTNVAPLYSGTPTFASTNPNATLSRNMTSFTINTGYVPSGTTYSYTISIPDDNNHGMWLNRVLQWMGSGFGFVGEPPTDYATYIGDQIEVTVS